MGVSSGFPQGSVHRLLLLSIFVTDLEKGGYTRFGDGTELFRIVKVVFEEWQKDP